MNGKSGKWKGEGGGSRETTSRTALLVSCCSPRAVRHVVSRLGVTLIELLIAIAIMATLSVMFLGASRAAMEHSRASRTKMTISKLHTLLMEQWASYETRRVDILPPPNAPPLEGKAYLEFRLVAQRIIMQMEMPDRWSDILGDAIGNKLPNPNATRMTRITIGPIYPITNPALSGYSVNVPTISNAYFRRYNTLVNDENLIERNQSAECLYLTIMYMTGDGEARTMFNAQDIGDTDEDGAPEFLDGWGQPISYFRWPAGFVSSFQPEDRTLPPPYRDVDANHDPYDPYRLDVNAFQLVPLIYSWGPDGKPGLILGKTDTNGNPYLIDSDGYYNGSPVIEGGKETTDHIDNIHNHLQEAR